MRRLTEVGITAAVRSPRAEIRSRDILDYGVAPVTDSAGWGLHRRFGRSALFLFQEDMFLRG